MSMTYPHLSSPSSSSSSSLEAPGLRGPSPAARVVVVDENQVRASSLAAALKSGSDMLVIVTAPASLGEAGPEASRSGVDLFPADLVLLALGSPTLSALATSAQAVRQNPYAEIVFYSERADTPEVAAAAVLGITRIVPAQSIVGWLGRAGALLARGAVLRRAAATAIAAVPEPPPLASVGEPGERLPLPVAEMQFRESYLRYLLSQCGSRQEAARRAGVPYRTMCEMIRKLGLSSEP